jgi:hypothetical protein
MRLNQRTQNDGNPRENIQDLEDKLSQVRGDRLVHRPLPQIQGTKRGQRRFIPAPRVTDKERLRAYLGRIYLVKVL